MAGILSHQFKNPVFFQNMETMLSNPKYCDTVFLVNNAQFHASSHVFSVASPELESLVDIHYENCGDREVRIGDIKHDDSFVVILRYIYGLTLDFMCMKKEVLCELIGLAVRFKLPALAQELKEFISELECFDVDTLVVLINTAKELHMEQLYRKLTVFAFKNADKITKHPSFTDLRYDILQGFVKSDFCLAEEIDILKGVLAWHGANMDNPVANNEAIVETEDGSSEMEEAVDKARHDDGTESMQVSNDFHGARSDVGIVGTFSQNILKTLLSHIRVKRINVLDLINLSAIEPYAKYKAYLENFQHFSVVDINRTIYAGPTYTKTVVCDVSKEYSNLCKKMNTVYQAEECYDLGGMQWTTCAKFFRDDTKDDFRKTKIFLKCVSPTDFSDWECTVVCQVKMLSIEPIIAIPGDDIYATVMLSKNNPCVEIGTFYYHCSWRTAFIVKNGDVPGNLFKVYYKSIHIKVKEPQEDGNVEDEMLVNSK